MRFNRSNWMVYSLLILMIWTLLFVVANQARGAAGNSQTIFFYHPGNLQHKIVSDLIHRYNPKLSACNHNQIIAAIFRAAAATGIDPFFITGVIAAESSFRPNAVSSCAAMGLMQLSPGVAKAHRLTKPLEITQNIYAGAEYLRYLKKRFQRDDLVLAAYNAGPSRVARLQRIPRIGETISYIRKISGLVRFMSANWTLLLQNLIRQPVICPLLADWSNQSSARTLSLQSRIVSFPLQEAGSQILRSDRQHRLAAAHFIFDRRLLLFA